MVHELKRSAFFLRAAKQFCVSKQTMYRWAKKFPINYIRIEYEVHKNMKLLTFRQVAKLFNCSRSSIYRWACEEGKLPFIRICGHTLRIREEDALKAIKEFREGEYNCDLEI